MEQANVSQKTFFSEDNLFMLLNVIHETVNDNGRFDKSNGAHRKLLFEIMTREFRGNTNMSLSELNKWVLKKTFQTTHVEHRAERPIVDDISYGTSTLSSSHTLSAGQGIRDADINQRQIPTQFQEYPQQTIVHKDTIISDNSPSNNRLNNAMQNLQNERNADTRDIPDTVDFQSVNTSQMDNSDIMNKLHALEATREPAVDPNANTNGSEIDLVAAMKTFDGKTRQLNDNIQTENSAIQQSKWKRENIFQESTVFRDEASDTLGESKVGNTSIANQITSDVESMHYTLLENENMEETAGTSKLANDVLVNQIALNNKFDDHAFQASLQLTNEEGALQQRLCQNVAGIQEELLIQPPNQFVNRVNYLEVSSNDRIRTLPTAEYYDTPYYFTVFFNSNRPGFRVFPIYDNYPIEDVVDFTKESDSQVQLNTMDVRRGAGLRGIPRIDGMVSIDNTLIMGYETMQLPCVGGPNIDSVFYNVVAIATNHVQIYYPYEDAPKYPYIILEIEQFGNVYRSSNPLVKKSFCKLFYDRSSTPTLTDSQYHMYTPMNHEKKTFQNPLANIDKMTYRLYNSFGNPLDAIPDILHVKHIYFDIDSTNPPSLNQSYINIVFQNYIPQENISVNNHITFEKCIEWYNKDWFQNWYESISSLIDAQNTLEEDYYDALLQNKGANKETLQKLKEDFSRKQIKFEYPTAGYVNGGSHPSFSALQEYLQHDNGHVVNRIGRVSGITFSEWSTLSENEQRYINAISIPMKTNVDALNGIETIHSFGDGNNTLNTLLLNDSDYPLITCTLLNNSVCTNISMSIYTQEEENVIKSQNV